jgi:hypothetical protein
MDTNCGLFNGGMQKVEEKCKKGKCEKGMSTPRSKPEQTFNKPFGITYTRQGVPVMRSK